MVNHFPIKLHKLPRGSFIYLIFRHATFNVAACAEVLGKRVSRLLADVRCASAPWAPVVRMETMHSSIRSILLLRKPQRPGRCFKNWNAECNNHRAWVGGRLD